MNNMEKICTKCNILKPETSTYFAKNKYGKYVARCKLCDTEYNKNYREKNKEGLSENKKEYYIKNSEIIINRSKQRYIENLDDKKEYDRKRNIKTKRARQVRAKNYYQENKERIKRKNNNYTINRYKTDEIFSTKMKLRHRLTEAFKRYSKNGKVGSSKDYNINWQLIIEYLGPCPGERAEYHIDHIIPLSMFDFDDFKQVELAFAPENHQWLKKEENLRKNANYDKQKFKEFLKEKMKMAELKYGTVIWFNNKRGIGFILPDDGSKDMFVHFTNVVAEKGVFKTLVAGQKVSYVVGANNKGPQAEKVVVIAEPKLEE